MISIQFFVSTFDECSFYIYDTSDHHNMNKYYMNKYYTTIGRNMVWLLNPTHIVNEGITRFGHILMNSTVDAVDVDCDYFLVTSLS